MANSRPSLKDRLSRLEAELDELIHIQESIRGQTLEDVNVSPELREQGRYRTISVATGRKAMFSSHRPCCIHDQAAAAPLTDISKFLQNINLNISKGTQAIAKLATSTLHDNNVDRSNNKGLCHDNHSTKHEYPHDGPNVWKSAMEKKNNEDCLYKELREEKDKRMRAENQLKCIKDELKKTKQEVEEKAEISIRLLQEELKDTMEKLKQAECEIQKYYDASRSAEYVWPLKYESLSNELQDEKQKRKEADENLRKLQDKLQKVFLDKEEHLALQKTANWIKAQNENLICLVKQLRKNIEAKTAEIAQKNLCIEDNFKKIKQLTGICGKLRDFLVVTKGKMESTEEKLKLSMEHNQRLSESLLHGQRQIEDLQRCLSDNKKDCTRLAGLLQSSKMKNATLYSRLEEISEIMKRQNKLMAQQSDTIENKNEQLKLANDNIKLQSQRLEDLEKKVSNFKEVNDYQSNNSLRAELGRLQLELENEKDNATIKDKIIDSHLKTISDNKTDLMRKESEINQLKREISEVERTLAIEKTKNQELLSKIKQLQQRKEELKRRVEFLEEECLHSSEHATKLEQIEKQIQLKQKEWEETKATLVKEKEEELKLLKSSFQMLADKLNHCEMQLASRQKSIDSLKFELQEKDSLIQKSKCETLQLTKQLQEAEERDQNMKKRFEENLQSACKVWQETMQQLKI